jgi:glycosyltransferase 2 family protein
MNGRWRAVLGIAVAAIFLALLLRHISLAEMRNVFGQARPIWLVWAVVAFLFDYACRIARWRLMLSQANPALRWRHCAGPLMASVAANNILPLRAGDLLRAFGFNKQLGIAAATSLSTLLVERLLDLLMVIALLGLALAYFNLEAAQFVRLGGGVLLLLGAVIMFLLLRPGSFKAPALGLAGWMAVRWPKIGHVAEQQAHKVFAALEYTAQGHIMLRLLGWSALAWLAEGMVFWLAALALPAIEAPLSAWLAMPVGTLATTVPSTPGFIGTFDYFTAQAMVVVGNAPASAAAFALLVHALLWLSSSTLGGIYLLVRSRAGQIVREPEGTS